LFGEIRVHPSRNVGSIDLTTWKWQSHWKKTSESSVPAGTTPNLLTGDFKKENFFSATLVKKGTRRSITFRS
jgi:hypothetical protein